MSENVNSVEIRKRTTSKPASSLCLVIATFIKYFHSKMSVAYPRIATEMDKCLIIITFGTNKRSDKKTESVFPNINHPNKTAHPAEKKTVEPE